MDNDAGARLAAQQNTPVKPHHERLKRLVNSSAWEEIGHAFGFTPRYTIHGGIRCFDWTSCNAEFWKVFLKKLPAPAKAAKPLTATTKTYRRILFEQQKERCYYCRHVILWAEWTIDHVLARSQGGSQAPWNKVGACKICNNKKGNRPVESFERSAWLARRREDQTVGTNGR